MKKSSKQNNKKQQAKAQRRQQRKQKLENQLNEQPAVAAEEVDPAIAAARQAALLARHQRAEWQKKVLAAKAATAKVEKRFNRGG